MTQKKKVSQRLFRDVFPGTKFTFVEKRASSVYIRVPPKKSIQRYNAKCIAGVSLGQKKKVSDTQTVFVSEEEEQRVEDEIEKKVNSCHFSRPSH